jgi:L-asparaginase
VRDVTIRIIITGGTFDKEYDELSGELTFKHTHLPRILDTVRCTVPVKVEINQLVDSLDMRRSNRKRILESCEKAGEDRVIITHGTDTMLETASLIGKRGLEKTIVLTGAMIPFAVKDSDAVFNLGCSITAVQLLPRGVYIVMNGRVFHWDNAVKNRKRGVFEAGDGSVA